LKKCSKRQSIQILRNDIDSTIRTLESTLAFMKMMRKKEKQNSIMIKKYTTFIRSAELLLDFYRVVPK